MNIVNVANLKRIIH